MSRTLFSKLYKKSIFFFREANLNSSPHTQGIHLNLENFLHIHKHSPARNIESLAEEIFHCDILELTVQADDVERELFG